MSAQDTVRAIEVVFEELRPHLPAGSGIKISPRTKWTVVQRADAGSVDLDGFVIQESERGSSGRPRSFHGSGVSVRGLGPWVPFLPRQLRRRLAAQSALETLLGLFYDPNRGDGFHRSIDYAVTATPIASGIRLAYTLPGASEAITLRPIPDELFMGQ